MNRTCRSTIVCVAVAMLLKTLAAQGAESNDPRGDIFAVLPAQAPHPSLGHHPDLFGRFVGTWDADYSFIAQDGSVRHPRGEGLFRWVLDGYADQDIFLRYPKPRAADERQGDTAQRFVD